MVVLIWSFGGFLEDRYIHNCDITMIFVYRMIVDNGAPEDAHPGTRSSKKLGMSMDISVLICLRFSIWLGHMEHKTTPTKSRWFIIGLHRSLRNSGKGIFWKRNSWWRFAEYSAGEMVHRRSFQQGHCKREWSSASQSGCGQDHLSGGQEEVQFCSLMDGVDGWPAGWSSLLSSILLIYLPLSPYHVSFVWCLRLLLFSVLHWRTVVHHGMCLSS